MNNLDETRIIYTNHTWDKYYSLFGGCTYLEYCDSYTVSPLSEESRINELTKKNGCSELFGLFRDLFYSLPEYEEEITGYFQELKENEIEFNEVLDLIKLSIDIGNKKVKWIDINPSVGTKIRITSPFVINDFGKVLSKEFNTSKYHKDGGKSIELKDKKKKNIGRPQTSYTIARLCYLIRLILDCETELRSKGKLISNEQAKFIFEFLTLCNLIKPESISVNEEDYIRTIMNNYKGKVDFLDIPI